MTFSPYPKASCKVTQTPASGGAQFVLPQPAPCSSRASLNHPIFHFPCYKVEKTTHKFLRGAGVKQLTFEHAAKPAGTFFPAPGSEGGLNSSKPISFPNFCELTFLGGRRGWGGAWQRDGNRLPRHLEEPCPAGKLPKGTSRGVSSLIFTKALRVF